ncbi:hypothetical protein EUTSA_v10005328mg [Eutrema salsugineum]|uniref:X8 domain-containing protein n=1 Tax=Eutrema salsugineum TaxID=72664 RepID=V4K133_EUTSA|nr:major pollen allergen Ole e 10 [Eutrema salsugineum]ESQ31585.1 hypothetical protein EUTSA_v10005328mg [Eutrema salsugineum]
MSTQLLTLLVLLSAAAIQHLPVATCNEWCVALPASTKEQLQANIDFGCRQVHCTAIQPGGSCYYPNTLVDHASFVMNSYYQSHDRTADACSFNNSGFLTSSDPSNGPCVY